MRVSKWGGLAGALAALLGAGAMAPAPVHAQDREPIIRALEIAGRGARIGVTVRDIDADESKQGKSGATGVVVDVVEPGGPADKAGMKAGDAITEFDGERIRSVVQFSRVVQETPAGRSVPAALSRGGQRVTVAVTPEQRSFSDDFGARLLDLPRAARAPRPPTPPAAPRTPRPPALLDPDMRFDMPGILRQGSGRRLGITLESIDDQLAEYFGVKEGVLVKSVQDGSSAQKAGIKAGDVITGINGTKVYDASDVNRAVERLEANGEYTVEIVREKKTQSLKGKVEPRDARGRTRTRAIL